MNRTPQIKMTELANEQTNKRTNDGPIDRRTKERPTKWTAAECCLLIEQIWLLSYISESHFFSMIHRLLLHFFSSSSCLLILPKTQLIASQYGWILSELCFYLFMDRDGAEVYIHAQNELINVAINWYIFLLLHGQLGIRYNNTTSVKAFLNEITKSKEEGM